LCTVGERGSGREGVTGSECESEPSAYSVAPAHVEQRKREREGEREGERE